VKGLELARRYFRREAAALVFLLRRIYRPFAKWIFHGLSNLGHLGCTVHDHLLTVADGGSSRVLQAGIEGCLGVLIDELVNQKLVARDGPYLLDYGFQIQRTIEDPLLREGLDSVE
jgi:hypothetical protein